MKNKSISETFAWLYIRFFSFFVIFMFKPWLKMTRTVESSIDIKGVEPKHNIILASNHQTLLDSVAIFASLSFKDLLRISPVKSMTWHKYYNSKYKPFMYSIGCFPSHGDGDTGVEGAVAYAAQNYSIFIYPEGKRTKPTERGPAYPGVSRIVDEVADAKLLLVHIYWHKRERKLQRPKFEVRMFEAPESLDVTQPDDIMNSIYNN